MTREEFIKVLDKKDYSYEMMGDSVVVNGGDSNGVVILSSLTSIPRGVVFRNRGAVYFSDLTSLPPDVVFKNVGGVILSSLTSIPRGVVFKNVGNVDLRSLTSLPPGVVFENERSIDLRALTSIPPGVVFENGGNIWLDYLLGGNFTKWKGNIEGIDEKRLLNKMIKDGVFER